MSNGTRPPRADVALDTANDLLDGAICECGHLESEHYNDEECRGRLSEGCELSCREYRPVAFRVERAS